MDPGLTAAELVLAIGPCRDDPKYWLTVIASLVKEGSLKPMPATRRGTGHRRRFSFTEARIAAVLFELKAMGIHHNQIGHVAQILRNGLEDMSGFRERWEAAIKGERMPIFIMPATPTANLGFSSDELPWVQLDSDSYFRGTKGVFKLELANIFKEMQLLEFKRDSDADPE